MGRVQEERKQLMFAPVPKLIEDVARGRMVILVDNENRENEGDLVMAAELATPEAVRFMATEGRGLICVPVVPRIADRLGLAPMTVGPTDPNECAFTISVDAREGTTTGISAFDRAHTIRLLASATTQPSDLKRPGHVFPLRAKAGGVLERAGHTEAAVDLARLAGLAPAGVICEIMKDDGTMARRPDLEAMAQREGILLGNIADLIQYRKVHPRLAGDESVGVEIEHRSSADLPTSLGVFKAHVFENSDKQELIVLTLGPLRDAKKREEPVLTRIHSACFTGDVLGSLRCDCGGQLNLALEKISEAGVGMLVYLPQEGRGIGLSRKFDAYRLQDEGLDTVEANHRLGFPADLRAYGDAARILEWFGVHKVRLLTNNPAKIDGLTEHGIEVLERVGLEVPPGPVNHSYLQAKKGKLGHLFEAM